MGGLLASERDRRSSLREMFEAGEMVLAPGCYDALGARLVEEAGFPAAYMTGFGYGNSINVIRTVREYEAAGVAAIHIEDQVMPKKCGHMEGKQVVPAREMAAKVSAAVAARRSPEFLIIARTDARGVEGVESALERGRAYLEAGADALFVEAPQSEAEIEIVPRSFPDVPLLFNYAEGGKTPPLSCERLRELGFSLVIFPLTLLLVATQAMRAALARVKADGTPIELLPSLIGFDEYVDFIGLPEIRELEQRFAEG